MTLQYLTTEGVKAFCRNMKAVDDYEFLTQAAEFGERFIATRTARIFAVAGATATERTYWTPRGNVLRFHDCTEVTAIGTLATTAYVLEPLNALSWDGEARPYEQATLVSGCWPYSTQGTLTVTAKWGWAAIPERVKHAALIVAKEVVQNRDDVKLGIVDLGDIGAGVARTNSHVRGVINDYRRVEAFGIA